MRSAKIRRETQETEVEVELNIDGTGRYDIQTGIGFFDHMLTQIAVHGLFDLSIHATGDLQVDEHHTIEDCALVLGAALKQALGEKRGIVRMASAFVPMDEALGQVVVDLSGRPYAVIQVDWISPTVGSIPVSLIEHFFESLAFASASNIQVFAHSGRDNHHISEAIFKSLARALDEAAQIDPRRENITPSSKGVM